MREWEIIKQHSRGCGRESGGTPGSPRASGAAPHSVLKDEGSGVNGGVGRLSPDVWFSHQLRDLTANTQEPGWLFLALTVFTILCNLRGSLVTICPSLGECPPMRAGTVFVSDSAFDVQCLVHAPCLFGERQNDRTHFRNLPLAASW